MENICSYCNQKIDVKDFRHPVTLQIKPTCLQCKNNLLSIPTYEKERQFLAKLGCLTPLLFILSILFMIFFNFNLGLWGIIISVITGIISFASLEFFIKKRNKNFGFGIEPKKLICCETCKNFKNVKDWIYISSLVKDLQEATEIPCKIFHKTQDVWIEYYNLSPDDRLIYPKNCPFWVKK